ncbi:MAG: hypothetical protein LBP73_10190 [Clostridiales Family XIII bacterium]|jgi:virulence-associated protein VapD|nr:hypothetical protein [Clostridiales Family XIII bacterium]
MEIVDEYKSRKQITFDLKQELLEKHYPHPKFTVNPKYYKKAYADVNGFMQRNDFEHRQYSVYASNKKLTTYNIIELIEKLAREMPWLSDCVNEIDVTDIGDAQHSIKQTLADAAKALNFNIEKESGSQADKTNASMSMND